MGRLTVLTSSVTLAGAAKGFFRSKISPKPEFGGHAAVTRSLVEGLKRIGVDFNYNPKSLRDVGEIVVVLSRVKALRQAIRWKREGRIKRLLAGPNLMVRSNEFDGILASPEVDICLVPSDWVRIAYEEDLPSLEGRIRCWHVGVDENFWQPEPLSGKKRTVLVYWKTEPEGFCSEVENLLRECGWNPVRIVYGNHNERQYKERLSESAFSLVLSRSESQGIALAEAWAMDVPTLVWNPGEFVCHGRSYSVVSSCPYLSASTGIEWVTTGELKTLLHGIEARLEDFRPRDWVLENMTAEISARNLLRIIKK